MPAAVGGFGLDQRARGGGQVAHAAQGLRDGAGIEQQVADPLQEIVQLDGLGDVGHREPFQAPAGALLDAGRDQKQHLQGAAGARQFFQQLEERPAQAAHRDVGQHQVPAASTELLHARFGPGDHCDPPAVAVEDGGQRPAAGRVVVNDEDPNRLHLFLLA